METGIFSRGRSMNSGDFVCFLEERSAAAMLKVIIPKLTKIDGDNIQCIVFEGKRDMQKKIRKRLADYNKPNCVFLVMRDKDSGDCKKIKNDLLDKVKKNKIKRTKIRIACHELESFYLGDLRAVELGIGVSNLSKMQGKTEYRTPDDRANASELLLDITEKEYQKVDGSRRIAEHLSLDGSNKSHSFNMLVSAIKELSAMLSKNGTA